MIASSDTTNNLAIPINDFELGIDELRFQDGITIVGVSDWARGSTLELSDGTFVQLVGISTADAMTEFDIL